MRAFLLRLLGADRPPPPRLSELAARVADVEHELVQLDARLGDAVDAIGARITNLMRRTKAQDPPEPTNGEEPDTPVPPKRFAPTAHLSTRFRRF